MIINEADFKGHFNVSRETLHALSIYHGLLIKWQESVNLVSKSTIGDIWERHFTDSAQISKYLPDKGVKIADIGAGAGFPGLVLVCMGYTNITLIESDLKKCLFLKEVLRKTGLRANVINKRIEAVDEQFDVVTARALAMLDDLLGYSLPLLRPNGYVVYLKGGKTDQELRGAKLKYSFEHEVSPSITSHEGRIVKISQLNVSRET